jgi:hypothetical protein
MTADEWIAAYAKELGTEPPSEAEISQLLELAATAAHSSERIAAPLACFLAGRDGRSVPDLHALAERVAG